MKLPIKIHYLILCISVTVLSGCAAPLLLAPLIGGTQDGDNRFTIDEATVKPEMREAFAKAKRLTILSVEKSVNFTAEYLDRYDFETSVEEPTRRTTTTTQRRKSLEDICRKGQTDLAMGYSVGESQTETSSSLGNALIGRGVADVRGTIDVMRCSNEWYGSFVGNLKMDIGRFSADRGRVAQIAGQEFAKALVKLSGRAPIEEPKAKQ